MAPLPALLAAAAGQVAGHAEGASEAGLPQLDFSTWPGQIFWLVVAFAALYFTLSRALLPRIGAVIEDRRDRIADDIDEAGRLQRQAEEARAKHERSLADARAKAHVIAGETRAKLAEELARDTRMTEAAVAKKTAEAESRIKAAADAAIANVKAVAGEAAAALVEKLAGVAPRREAVAKALQAAERSGGRRGG
jgi:F-type H+-transporting ATPase subunit b